MIVLALLSLLCLCHRVDGINCPLPSEWRYELTLTPFLDGGVSAAMSTDGTELLADKAIFVACQIGTWTFMNRYRSITEHTALMKKPSAEEEKDRYSDWWKKHYWQDEYYVNSVGDYIDSLVIDDKYDRTPGSIIVQCKGGIFNPDVFTNFRNWCAEGCPKVSKQWLTFYHKDITYPKGSLSLDPFKAPVQRLPESKIQLPCHYGFAASNSTRAHTSGTYCTTSGYQPPIVMGEKWKKKDLSLTGFTTCKAGCEDPQIAIPNSLFSGNSETGGDKDGGFMWGKEQTVTMACKPGFQIYGSGYRICLETEETWKDFYGQKSYKKAKGLYWDPAPTIMYCYPMNPSLANLAEGGSDRTLPCYMLLLFSCVVLFV